MDVVESYGQNTVLQRVRNQYLATVVANLVSLIYGFGLGWASPNVPLLLSENSPLTSGPVSIEESSWISSLFCIGGAVGSVTFSWLLDLLGRKWTVTLIGVPQVISWGLIAFLPNISALYVARFLIGLSGGGTIVSIPVFVAEISNDNIRGVLGFIMGVSICSGTLVTFVLSHYFPYFIMPSIAFVSTVIFLLIFQLFPDTPQSLLNYSRHKAAEKSVQFYKQLDDPKLVAREIERVTQHIQGSGKNGEITLAELLVPTTRKGILIGFVAIAMTQFCGSFAIINYTGAIFKDAGSTLHPNVCAMVIAVIQVLATFVSICLIDRVGRKVLLMVSASLTALFLTLLGLYFYLNSQQDYDMSSWSLLPLISLSGMMFVVIGISTMPYVVVVEILPPKLRSTVPSAFMLMLWILGFLFVKYFNNLIEVLHMHGCMWFFAGCCCFEFIFLAIMLPETKGKSYEEIKQALS